MNPEKIGAIFTKQPSLFWSLSVSLQKKKHISIIDIRVMY